MSQTHISCIEDKEIPAQAQRLPMAALLALAMTGFICIATETLPAGLLPQMVPGLQVSPSLIGQMITAYALGSVLAAIPLALATQRWRRRNVLLLTIGGFFVFNTVTALSSSYVVTLAARFLLERQQDWPGACLPVTRAEWWHLICREKRWRWLWLARQSRCRWVSRWEHGWERWWVGAALLV